MAAYDFTKVALGPISKLEINGTNVGWLKGDVEYEAGFATEETFKSDGAGGPALCTGLHLVAMRATVTAQLAEITSGNIGLFLPQSNPSNSDFAIVTNAKVTCKKPTGSIVVNFPKAHLLARSIRFGEGVWVIMGCLIRLAGDGSTNAFPAVTIT